jgi:hypothetical protein
MKQAHAQTRGSSVEGGLAVCRSALLRALVGWYKSTIKLIVDDPSMPGVHAT